MSPAETEDFILGLARRGRGGWEQSAMLARVVHKVLTGKNLDLTFPWQEERRNDTSELPTEEELQALSAKAAKAEELIRGL